jgi:hypothetical protein
MSVNSRKTRSRRTIAIISCGLLIVISLVTSLQQIPTIAQTTKIYDEKYISALRRIGNIIPQNETLTTSENYPQVAFFTGHKVKNASVKTERALVQFMWKFNSSYLLVPKDNSEPGPDATPLLIQIAEKPFKTVFDYYDEYISKLESQNSPLFPQNTSLLNISEEDNTPLKIHKIITEDIFQKLFEKILDVPTEGSILHLYHLRSNITRDNLYVVTDKTRPLLSVSLPVNGTIMQSNFGITRVNVIGSANDTDSNIKEVEISIDGAPFKLTTPKKPNDWSTWSFTDFVPTTEGTNRILVRATDEADNRISVPVYITVK